MCLLTTGPGKDTGGVGRLEKESQPRRVDDQRVMGSDVLTGETQQKQGQPSIEEKMGTPGLSSSARIAANHRNSLKSTGPHNTSSTRFNAMKHGLTAKKMVVTPYESEKDYEVIVEGLRQDFHPKTNVEEILIQQVANTLWRRQRLVRMEKTSIESRLVKAPIDFDSKEDFGRNRLRDRIHSATFKQAAIGLTTKDRYAKLREEAGPEMLARLKAAASNPLIMDRDWLESARKEYRALGRTGMRRRQLHLESQIHPDLDHLWIRYDSTLEHQFSGALKMLLEIQQKRDARTLTEAKHPKCKSAKHLPRRRTA
jgi:hypothetical protein